MKTIMWIILILLMGCNKNKTSVGPSETGHGCIYSQEFNYPPSAEFFNNSVVVDGNYAVKMYIKGDVFVVEWTPWTINNSVPIYAQRFVDYEDWIQIEERLVHVTFVQHLPDGRVWYVGITEIEEL